MPTPPCELQKQRWFVDAVEAYCVAVDRLGHELDHTEVRSRGLLAFRHYLNTCTGSDEFKAIAGDTQRLEADLSWVRYRLHIQGPRIRVNSYDPEPDYSADVEQTFEKFKQGPVDGYRFEFPSAAQMNYVEAAILDREVQFYVACLEHVERFKSAGLAFCRSEVTSRSKDVFGREIFDLALANKLVREHAAVVASLGSSSRRRGAVSRQCWTRTDEWWQDAPLHAGWGELAR